MANDGFKPRPLVDANLVTDFGGVELTPEFMAEGTGQKDYTYVPGFSEMQVNRQLDLAALHRGEIRGKDVRTLDYNARWYRCANKAGEADNGRAVAALNEGYVPATKNDIGKPWLTKLPPRAQIMPDGTIRISGGDLQLFVTGKENAAKNAMRKKIRTEEMVDGMEFSSGGLGTVTKVADPYVEKTIGTPANGGNQK